MTFARTYPGVDLRAVQRREPVLRANWLHVAAARTPAADHRDAPTTTLIVRCRCAGLWYNASQARAWLNGKALAFQVNDTGSIPVARFRAHSSMVRAAGFTDRTAKSNFRTCRFSQGAAHRETDECLPAKLGEA